MENVERVSFGRKRDRSGAGERGRGERFFLRFSKEGQSDRQAAVMTARFGRNILTEKKQKGFFRRLVSSFNDPIIKILVGSLIINAAVSLGRMNIAETVGIAAAIVIATLVSTVSEYASSLAFERLRESSGAATCTVRRGGEEKEIPCADIAVGDVVILRQGMTVPADGILISGNVKCDQASLTGEGRPCQKAASAAQGVYPESIKWSPSASDQLFRASLVCGGEGEMIAVRVGDATFIGEVAGSLQDGRERKSPLKHRLSDLAHTISYIGYVGAAMIAFAYLFNSFVIDSGMDKALILEKLSDTGFVLSQVLRAITVAVSVVVVAVPEGLPMMITVVLSSNMRKMLANAVLVRRLLGIETAGNMNILFTDKTGTLTSGKMSVCELHTADGSVTGAAELRRLGVGGEIESCISCACNIKNAGVEKALASFIGGRRASTAKRRLAFSSALKLSAAVNDRGTAYFVGAPEKLIAASVSYFDMGGTRRALGAAERGKILEKLARLGDEAKRVVCLAAGGAEDFDRAALGTPCRELTFICLAAMKDPVRRGVPASVAQAHKAGIQVVMVTGDNPNTAAAVAKECGIPTRDCGTVLEAERLHAMTDEEVKAILPQTAVVSRALPQDKIRLVRLAQECKKVVGMTGDGINDAPALKAADVGFSMGSGTDIAKEAGDVVITDDSFSSITKAVLYGRTVFESIRKFIVFQLLMNLSAMGVSLIGPFIGIDSPVTVIQMLWVNIIMDTLGGLAFAGEPALQSYMRRSAVPLETKLISPGMFGQILMTGSYTLALSIFFLKSSALRAYFGGSDTYYLTAFFAMFIFCGIFNSFNVRTPSANLTRHLGSNKPFMLIMTLVAAIQLLIVYFGGEVFRCEPLSARHLATSALIATSVIPADLLRKLLFAVCGKKCGKS